MPEQVSAVPAASRRDRDPLLPYFFRIPNLLALDAAFFAACWQGMANRSFGIELSWAHGLLVALAIWLGYTADRWLDAIGMRKNASTMRHRFAFRYRKWLLIGWWFTLIGSVTFACWTLAEEELLAGFALAAICGVNACLNYFDSKGRFLAPKELRASLLLASGIHLFLWTQLAETGFTFGLSFAAITLLCFLNCCFISKWEMHFDLDQGQSSLALRRKIVSKYAVGITLGAAILSSTIGGIRSYQPEGVMLQAVSVALLALPIIDKTALHPEDKRVMADASLFLPCLLLVS